MTTADLPHRLDRVLTIDSPPDRVFRYFTSTERWAAWWGAGSTIEPRPGGALLIRYPGGVEVAGKVVDIDAPHRIVFTYGFVSGSPIPAGASLVSITLERVEGGTRLRLTHAFADAELCAHHVQGWRYQLSVFSNVVANEQFAEVDATVDGWFAAWREPDEDRRRHMLEGLVRPDVRFRDQHSHVVGLDELVPHIGAAQRFMPNIRLERRGTASQCQGVAVADWAVVTTDGEERGRGRQVFTLAADGRIRDAVGFWNV
jgi:uncharacterized protein YndB with AHSA1/START domain